jgi:hypothetical protein
MKRLLLAALLVVTAIAQTAPNWKDQGESDIGIAASSEKDPAKQLDLLRKWEQQYPDSALKGQRELMVAQAQLKILQAAYTKTDPALLSAGQKAGQDLEAHFRQYFDDANKPATVTPDQWATARQGTESQVHLIMAYIAGVQKNDQGAEDELKRLLQVDPNQAVASYQLGLTILHEMSVSKDLVRYPEALYDLARSLEVTGPTALTPQTRAKADESLRKQYSNYHGSTEGLDDLIKQTASAALPPPDFHLRSIDDIAAEKAKDHAAWAAQHPDLDLWENIKNTLMMEGDAYFTNLKDVGFPPARSDSYKGPDMFTGKVVSQPDPKSILVNVDNAPAGDCLLKFDDSIRGTIPEGTELKFKGVVEAWTKDPNYVLTINIQEPKTDLAGLPDDVKFGPAAKPPASAARKPGAKAPAKPR